MKIDAGELKQQLREQLQYERNGYDVVAKHYNRGIRTAIKLVEIKEDAKYMMVRIRKAGR